MGIFRGKLFALDTLVSVFRSCTLCRSVTLIVGSIVLLLPPLPLLLLLLLLLLLALELLLRGMVLAGGAGGAGGGGGATEMGLGASSSVASGMAGRGPGGMDTGGDVVALL